IEQYFQIQDYALWDVIENRNSFKPVAQTVEGSSTPHIPGPVTDDEKIQKKNDVKARSMLLMGLPNEHLMTFNQYKDAKSFFNAITTRFSRNDATRKTQKTLLKQMYKNFSSQSIENKSDLDKLSIDDLYNNFKIVEQEIKRNDGPSLSSGSQNMALVSTPSTSNNYDVSTIFGVSTASPQVSTANLSDATVFEVAIGTAKRFFQKNGKKITINESDNAGYDKAKENRTRNQETTRRTVNVEDTYSKAMVSIDGAGFDWSYMADDEAPTNMAFMDFSNSEIQECMVQKVKASDASSGEKDYSRIVLDKGNDQSLENQSNTSGDESSRKTRILTRRMCIRIPQSNVPSSVADEAITKEMHDRLERATTTASILEAEQGIDNISKTQTKKTLSGPSSPRTSSEGGPGCHITMGGVFE
nr:hypothetical protein [Tanacetum cinerariifolium]